MKKGLFSAVFYVIMKKNKKKSTSTITTSSSNNLTTDQEQEAQEQPIFLEEAPREGESDISMTRSTTKRADQNVVCGLKSKKKTDGVRGLEADAGCRQLELEPLPTMALPTIVESA